MEPQNLLNRLKRRKMRFSDQDDCEDELMESSPEFVDMVRRSRQQLKDGKCARMEDVWDEIMKAPEPK